MVLKRFFSLIILSIMVCLISLQVEGQKVKRVVIDAGHGGHDPGALGKSSREKDISLAIALKTGKFIEENLPDVQVIYTRKSDVFVELYRRAKIANEAKADLFISIHCNANKSATPYGAETYVMGLHKSEANLQVAQTENSSILLEDDFHVKYDGFDPTSPEGYIFFTMLQNAFMDQSLNLASNVQKHFKDRVNLFDRGVKQAGFLVLYKTTMPSVLIETGFISNAKEEKMLSSDEGQTYIASAIFRAVKDYKHTIERTPNIPYKEEQYVQKVSNTNESSSLKDSGSNNSTQKKEPQLLAQNDIKISELPSGRQPVNEVPQPITVYNTTNTPSNDEPKPSEKNIVYKVQFLVSKNLKNTTSPEFKGLDNVDYYIHNGLYKYTYGNEEKFDLANQLVKQLNAKGFKDCFVVAFMNSERIDVEEAKRLQVN